MCGFVGFIDLHRTIKDPEAVLRAASALIARRGPDAESFRHEGPVHLAHRRLAIVDLTDSGLQPMESAGERYVIVFNGEIYNYETLRRSAGLGHIQWRGHSDTEVLIEHIAAFGLDATLSQARGMFSFALWDRQEQTLTLARDRLGEKPLFFGWTKDTFVFGSELKVLKAFDNKPKIDDSAVAQYLRYGYVPSPLTIFEGFQKVLPGTMVTFSLADINDKRIARATTYWSINDAERTGAQMHRHKSFEDRANELEGVLKQSVSEQLMADVPVGALLSGGIDSSLVAAIAQAVSAKPIKTFTIGFNDPKYDEAPYARAIAAHLGTEHQELYIGEKDLLGLVSEMSSVYDEPFADASQLPTLLVARLVRKHVTVCLSGDGGDELFRGYERYLRGRQMWNRLACIPSGIRKAGAGVLTALSPQQLDKLVGPLKKKGVTGDRIHKASAFLGAADSAQFYEGLTQLPGGLQLIKESHRSMALTVEGKAGEGFTDYASRWDSRYYLPDDILVKVDRAAMHESLEMRVPLLRPEMLDMAWGLSEAEHISGTSGKQLLRAVLNKYVPPAMFERPKQGFGVPMDAWLRGPLKAWANARLQGLQQRDIGCLDKQKLDSMWGEHMAGRRNWASALWAACMLEEFLSNA